MPLPESLLRPLAIFSLTLAAVAAGGATMALGASISTLPGFGANAATEIAGNTIEVKQPKCPPYCVNYGTAHHRFHQRYRPNRPGFDEAHRRFHHHHHRPHAGPIIRFGFLYDYYDPYYYDPYYFDPYWYPPHQVVKLSCSSAGRLLRKHGYRNVKAYDCAGRSYGFYANYKGQRYKVTVRARDGRILSRVKY
jgi:hypothetical protein